MRGPGRGGSGRRSWEAQRAHKAGLDGRRGMDRQTAALGWTEREPVMEGPGGPRGCAGLGLPGAIRAGPPGWHGTPKSCGVLPGGRKR